MQRSAFPQHHFRKIIILVCVALMRYVLPVEEDYWYQKSQFIPQIVTVIEEFGPVLWEQGEERLDKNQEVSPNFSPERLLTSRPEQVGT